MKRRRLLLLVAVPVLATGAALFWPRDDPERDIAAMLAGSYPQGSGGEPWLDAHGRYGIRDYMLPSRDLTTAITRARRHLAPPGWREAPLFNGVATFNREEPSTFAIFVHTTPGLRVLRPLVPRRYWSLSLSLSKGGLVQASVYRTSERY